MDKNGHPVLRWWSCGRTGQGLSDWLWLRTDIPSNHEHRVAVKKRDFDSEEEDEEEEEGELVAASWVNQSALRDLEGIADQSAGGLVDYNAPMAEGSGNPLIAPPVQENVPPTEV